MNNAPNTGQAEQWFARALETLPGGVSSPVRAFRSVGGRPRVIRSGGGAEVVDEDGNRYLDFVGSWGPLILGHAHPVLIQAVRDAAERGTSFGAPSRPEIELAELVVDSYPGIEQVRFVSSGTEAVMSAVRLARGITGRDLVVKFSGCYHGHVDYLLVAAGSGLATFGRPSSDGVPDTFAELTRVLPLDDEDAVTTLFDKEGAKIAAVIIEPVQGIAGAFDFEQSFITSARAVCDANSALLIRDEVKTGVGRLGTPFGADYFGVSPDLITTAKSLGSGFPCGAVLMRNDMARDLGPGALGTTFGGGPLACAAIIAVLDAIKAEDLLANVTEVSALIRKTCVCGPVTL